PVAEQPCQPRYRTSYSSPGEELTQPLDGPGNAHFRGRLTDTQSITHAAHRLALEKTDEDREAVFLAECRYGFIEKRFQALPDIFRFRVVMVHFHGPLLTLAPAYLSAHDFGGSKASSAVEPT